MYGAESVKERKTTLTSVLVQMLKGHDAWLEFTDAYLAALDHVAPAPAPAKGKKKTSQWEARKEEMARESRAENLAEWNDLLLERLQCTDGEDCLHRLVHHPAFTGVQSTFLQSKLAYLQGNQEQTRRLLKRCLQAWPTYRSFRAFADEIGLDLTDR